MPVAPEPPPAGTGDNRAGSGAADSLTAVIDVLRQAGLDPTAREVADGLWLAQWARRTRPVTGDGAARPVPVDGESAGDGPPPDQAEAESGSDAPVPPADEDGDTDPVGIHPIAPGEPRAGAAGLPVRVAAAPTLPHLLELQRALRPLQRFRPSAPALRQVLDESATAERSARAGLVLPVFQSVARRETSIQLLVDASASMAVWDRTLQEVRQVCEQLGAFRDVQVHRLHEVPGGPPLVGTGPRHAERLRPADQLRDPTGRQLTLLISDCVGPLWRSGEAHRLLHRWGRQAPVAVLQPLPQRLWARTRLPVEAGTLLRDDEPGARLRFVSARRSSSWEGGLPGPADTGALPVPVLVPNAAALGTWARLLSGTGSASAPGAVGWVRADQAAAPAAPRSTPRPPREVVRRFRATASRTAVRLAVYLAATPLTLPVMQLVQRTMLPDSGPAELAEVLFSGMLVRLDDPAGDGEPWYDFADGVRSVLLGPLARDEATLVLKHCSEYVSQRFGTGVRNFPAVAAAQLSGTLTPSGGSAGAVLEAALPTAGGQRAADRAPRPFAEVSYQVLRRYLPQQANADDAPPRGSGTGPEESGPELLERAEELIRAGEADGSARPLLDAADLLRRAGEFAPEPVPRVQAALARALLGLWESQGDFGVLEEAGRCAEAAAADERADAWAHRVLGRVAHALAGERLAAGDRTEAWRQLEVAERELRAVGRWPGLPASQALVAWGEWARVMWHRWRHSADTDVLETAERELSAVVREAAPDGVPGDVVLQLGRARLALAGAADDGEAARQRAQQAVLSLEAALEVLPTDRDGVYARALLDLADALLIRGGGRTSEALAVLNRARPLVVGSTLEPEWWVRTARVRRSRFARHGGLGELDLAAEAYAAARRLLPAGDPAYADVLLAWGETELDRARAVADGVPPPKDTAARGASAAVRVLREARAELAGSDRRLSRCLLLLGRALLQRYVDERDVVDLREGEFILSRAAGCAPEPLARAEAWYEHGRAEEMLDVVGHLERAAASYRDAAAAADDAASMVAAAVRSEVARLAARALHRQGAALLADGRVEAARAALERAREGWRHLPDGGGAEGERTEEGIRRLSG